MPITRKTSAVLMRHDDVVVVLACREGVKRLWMFNTGKKNIQESVENPSLFNFMQVYKTLSIITIAV